MFQGDQCKDTDTSFTNLTGISISKIAGQSKSICDNYCLRILTKYLILSGTTFPSSMCWRTSPGVPTIMPIGAFDKIFWFEPLTFSDFSCAACAESLINFATWNTCEVHTNLILWVKNPWGLIVLQILITMLQGKKKKEGRRRRDGSWPHQIALLWCIALLLVDAWALCPVAAAIKKKKKIN